MATRTYAAWGIALAALCGSSAGAQGSDTPQPDGYKFYWPGQCLQAIKRSDAYYWRAREDSVAWTPASDSVLDDSKRVARECVTKFSASPLVAHDLVPLGGLYLATREDAKAKAAFDRRLAEADVKAVGTRAWVLAQIVGTLLGGSPARLNEALAYTQQVDALKGDSAAVGKALAHLELAQYYRTQARVAEMIAQSEAVIAAGKELNTHDRSEYVGLMLSAYRYMAEAEGDRTGDSTAALAVIARARTDIGSLVPRQIASYTKLFGLYGKPVKPLVATQWIITDGDTLHPKPGKLALVEFNPYRGSIPGMRRLQRQFSSDIDVASIRGLNGYFRDLGPLATDAELKELRNYYASDLRATSAIGLVETKYHKLPDGRRVRDNDANDANYGTDVAGLLLIDRNGIIRRVWGGWHPTFEPRIAAALSKYR